MTRGSGAGSGRRAARSAAELVALAGGLARSGSRMEDLYWERRLAEAVDRGVRGGHEQALAEALERTWQSDPEAYEALLEAVEARCEGTLAGQAEAAVMIAVPVLAWSRERIPAGPLSEAIRGAVRECLSRRVLAEGVRLALADRLFSPEQLPEGYVATARLADRLAARARRGSDLAVDGAGLVEPGHYLADARYVLGAVSLAPGAPLFRWHEAGGDRRDALRAWRGEIEPVLAEVLPGCALEVLLPDAVHSAWRQADEALRAFGLRACIEFLFAVLDLSVQDLQAIVAPVRDAWASEYRVSFVPRRTGEVVQGSVWPLIGAEEMGPDAVARIRSILEDMGVTDIRVLETPMAAEYCEDCGAPLFPDTRGEAVHAGIPDHLEPLSPSLH